jgi:hypothetical protein
MDYLLVNLQVSDAFFLRALARGTARDRNNQSGPTSDSRPVTEMNRVAVGCAGGITLRQEEASFLKSISAIVFGILIP